MSPEARVFRPRSETEDRLIDSLLKVHALSGDITKPSWTAYVSWLMNRDIAERRVLHSGRIRT